MDDVLGGDAERGWKAHLRALAAGRLSAGGIKLFGGGVLALMLASAAGSTASGTGGVLRLAADGALVALAANLANAFDRAPGPDHQGLAGRLGGVERGGRRRGGRRGAGAR